MAPSFRRKQNRLPLEEYRVPRVYSLTLTCAERRAVFTDSGLIEGCIETLRSCSEKHGSAVLAFCFMPDHVHLLVEGGDRSELPKFVKDFKQRTGYEYRRVNGNALWQKSYHDHVLRSDDVHAVARYIVGNPVRAGIVGAAADYPYS